MEKKEINIIDLFEEKTETSSGAWKTTCPSCGLQGGRTEGFILFPETNMAYCHSTQRNFNLLEAIALKHNLINCSEGRETEEKGTPLVGELFIETKKLIEEEYGVDTLNEIFEKIGMVNYDNFFDIEYNKEGEIKKVNINIDAVADHIIDTHNIKTIYGLREETIYVYQEGIWTQQGRGLVKAEVEKLLRKYAKNNVVNEILEKVKRKTKDDRNNFNIIPENMMCYENGVLDFSDIDNIKFLDHNKEYNFKSKIPVKFNPKADCPKIKEFIKNTFYEVDQPQVQEWLGFHNSRRYFLKKAAILAGVRDTGKTVFLNLLMTFLGKENVANLNLQEITRGKPFDLLALENKLANIHDDLSSRDMNDGGGFKMAVGDGEISGEEKFGDRRRFRNTAKNTFSCNAIPSVKDIDDDAYYSRWLIWILEKSISKEKQDPKLIDKLTTEEELSGLLNWSIEGLKRLIKNKQFTNEQDSEYNKELMMQNSNSIAKFANHKLKYVPGESVTKDEMYKIYCAFCNEQKPSLTPVSKTKLGNDLYKFATYLNPDLRTDKIRSWGNVCIHNNDNYTTLENNMCNYQKSDKIQSTNNIYVFSESGIPVIDLTKKKTAKMPQNHIKDTKKCTEREEQFFDSKDSKSIFDKVVEEDKVVDFIKNNPNTKTEDLYIILGDGSLKTLANLHKKNIVKTNDSQILEVVV